MKRILKEKIHFEKQNRCKISKHQKDFHSNCVENNGFCDFWSEMEEMTSGFGWKEPNLFTHFDQVSKSHFSLSLSLSLSTDSKVQNQIEFVFQHEKFG
jgi:hypothetical protein